MPQNVFFQRIIYISGSAIGMGLDTAKPLAFKCAKVSLLDAKEEAFMKLALDIEKDGGKVLAKVVDIKYRAQVEARIRRTADAIDKLDGATDLAGVIGKNINVTLFEDVDDEHWDFVVGINQKGLLNYLCAQLPYFNDGGSIGNTANLARKTSNPL